jgi:hypothetical protein
MQLFMSTMSIVFMFLIMNIVFKWALRWRFPVNSYFCWCSCFWQCLFCVSNTWTIAWLYWISKLVCIRTLVYCSCVCYLYVIFCSSKYNTCLLFVKTSSYFVINILRFYYYNLKVIIISEMKKCFWYVLYILRYCRI